MAKSVVVKQYRTPEGDLVKTARPDATALVFTKESTGESFEVHVAELPDDIRTCAAWHGISQKLGDSYAGAKSGDLDHIEAVSTLWERLMIGEWVAQARDGGGSPTVLIEAIAKVLTDLGQTVDDDRMAGIKEKVKDKDTRDSAMADPAIKAAYAEIQVERAKKRAQEAKKAAKSAEGESMVANF